MRLLGGGTVRRRQLGGSLAKAHARRRELAAMRARFIAVMKLKGVSHAKAARLWRHKRLRGGGFWDSIKSGFNKVKDVAGSAIDFAAPYAKGLLKQGINLGGKALGGLANEFVPGSSILVNGGASALNNLIGDGVRRRRMRRRMGGALLGSGIRLRGRGVRL